MLREVYPELLLVTTAGSRCSPLNSAIQMGTLRSGDAFASLLPTTLSQRQLYPTNNLLRKSVLDKADVVKLDESVGECRWRRSILENCEERNALSCVGIMDQTLP